MLTRDEAVLLLNEEKTDPGLMRHALASEAVLRELALRLGQPDDVQSLGRLQPAHRRRVDDLLELCGLSDLAGQRPGQISGGQRQRTALARSLATEPDLLLLDEPFTALDQPLRERMRAELFAILERFDMPMVMVSHDLDDVDHFAQTLVAFGRGRVLDVVDYEARRRTESARQILDPLFLAAETRTV